MANGTRPPVSPLGDKELADIKQSLKQLDEAQEQVNLAKRAEFDVSAEEQKIREARTKLQKIRQVYFPNE